MQAFVFSVIRNKRRNKGRLLDAAPNMLRFAKPPLDGAGMERKQGVPTPDDADSGVSGTQQAGDAEDVTATPPPLEGQLLHRTFIGLVAGSPDMYGGEQNAPIIGALISDSAYDKDQARILAAQKQQLLDEATSELNEQKLKYARLEERVHASHRTNIALKICTFFSPIALSLAVDLFKANSNSSLLIGAIGLGLLLTNFIPERGKN